MVKFQTTRLFNFPFALLPFSFRHLQRKNSSKYIGFGKLEPALSLPKGRKERGEAKNAVSPAKRQASGEAVVQREKIGRKLVIASFLATQPAMWTAEDFVKT